MKTRQCVSCGAREGMRHFEGRGETLSVKGRSAVVARSIAGWECQQCGEDQLDDDTDSAERYSDAGDKLVLASASK